jgi:hypothetical protein
MNEKIPPLKPSEKFSGSKSPEDLSLSVSLEEIKDVLSHPDHTPEQVMELFMTDFGDYYRRPAGVIEGYTLGQHTYMALKQYHKYFKHKGFPSGFDNVWFETILALHDIGKPDAALNNDIANQYQYHEAFLTQILPKYGFEQFQVAVALEILNDDPIRLYLYKYRNNPEEVVDLIKTKAEKIGLAVTDFWYLLKLLWYCDASSYTVDAGGKASLDRMFEFEPEEGELHLAPHVKKYFDELEKLLFT